MVANFWPIFISIFFQFYCKESQVGGKIEQKLKWKLVENWPKILTVSVPNELYDYENQKLL